MLVYLASELRVDIVRRNKNLELHRVAVAARDIGCAKDGFNAIISLDSNPADHMYQVLLFGAVISYCRPFIGSEGLGKSSTKWTRFDDRKIKNLHTDLLSYRNSTVAHSDIDNNQLHIYPTGMILRVGNNEHKLDEPMFGVSTPLLKKDNVPLYIKLCDIQCKRMYEFLIPEMESRFRNRGLPTKSIIFKYDEV